ncbi:MAG: TonB family protein, partial [Alphaproteobacteria bacterium]
RFQTRQVEVEISGLPAPAASRAEPAQPPSHAEPPADPARAGATPFASPTASLATLPTVRPPVPSPAPPPVPGTVSSGTQGAEPREPVPPARVSPGRAAAVAAPDYRPAQLNNRKPHYPLSARRRNQEGRVVLEAEVTASGSSTAVQIVQSSGVAALDQAAMEAVRDWRFLPGRRDGVPVTASVSIPVVFRLK